MKKLLFILSIFLIMSAFCDEILKGSISVSCAREKAFAGISKTIPADEIRKYKYDLYHYLNLNYIKENKLLIQNGYKDRILVPFYTKRGRLVAYGVQYKDDPDKKLYYTLGDRLIKYEKDTSKKGVFPYKTAAYDINGNLVNISLYISQTESFVFNKNEKLLAHWVNDECYNEKGKLRATRSLEQYFKTSKSKE